mgnify:CR=1 FL=1
MCPVTAGQPRPQAIADVIEAEIRSGVFPPGTVIPGRRALARKYQAGLDTVTDAVRELISRGLVVALSGAGTYVVDALPAPGVRPLSLEERVAALEEWRRRVDPDVM